MPDALCLGEILIDFVSTHEGLSVGQAPAFEKKPGGAPANVAVGLARLGVSTGFIGKVGRDAFGDFLRQTLIENSVDTAMLSQAAEAHTTLAFVSLAAQGERSFVFYRNPGVDTQLAPSDIDAAAFAQARVFHFGSLSLTHDPARSATLAALDLAERHGLLISYDPNLREALWPNLETAREQMLSVLPQTHIVKVSGEEAVFLTNASDATSGAQQLAEMGPKVIFVTLGSGGCIIVRRGRTPLLLPGFKVQSVDTTGAGDAFAAAVLARLLSEDITPATLAGIPDERLRRIGVFANAAGALATTQKGAIPAMPGKGAIEALTGVEG